MGVRIQSRCPRRSSRPIGPPWTREQSVTIHPGPGDPSQKNVPNWALQAVGNILLQRVMHLDEGGEHRNRQDRDHDNDARQGQPVPAKI